MPKIVDHEQRRQEIASAAFNVISTEGISNSSMRRIAEEAGCTTGRLTHYFPNRQAIVLAVTRRIFRAAAVRMVEIEQSDLPPIEMLRQWLYQVLPLDDQRRREAIVRSAFRSEAALAANRWDWVERRADGFRDSLGPMLAAAGVDRTVDEVAVFTDGLLVRALLEPTRLTPSKIVELLDRFLGVHVDETLETAKTA